MAKINVEHYVEGAVLGVASATVKAEITSPPSYYTEASLLAAMAEAHKFVKDPAKAATLKETNGIGTARTRSEVIKALLKSAVIKRVGKGKKAHLEDSQAGRSLNQMTPEALKDVGLSAGVEQLFARINKGTADEKQVSTVIQALTTKIVDEARRRSAKTNPQNS